MIKLVQLLFAPITAWNKVAEAQRSPVLVFLLNPLPLMLLGAFVEGCGLVNLGLMRSDFAGATPLRLEPELAQRYEYIRLGVDLGLLFLGAVILNWIGQSFDVVAGFNSAFTVVSYSLGPIYLAHALDGVPQINTWLCWGIGAVLMLRLLYHGVGAVMKPDQTKGFGLFMCCAVVLLILTGLAHFMLLVILERKLLLAA